ncbi:MAG: hypothetical protein ACK4QL_09595 [Pseudanabaenaceae cyanobacterium]
MFLRSLTKYLPTTGRPLPYVEQQGFSEVQPRKSSAQLLETPLQSFPVSPTPQSQLTHFLDGIQRSWLISYLDHVPIYYGYTAAVIRSRTERHLYTWDYRTHEALYLPFSYIPDGTLITLQTAGFLLIDTRPPANGSAQTQTLQEFAQASIAQQRQKLEEELAERWLQTESRGYLVIDGSLNLAQPRTIGLIKSHNTQYFSFPEQGLILSLPTGQRSSLFQPAQRSQIISWYLRLREQQNRDPYFGLVRVEAPLELQAMVTEISSWLLWERRPLSLPDPRWDRLIYPIRNCEEFLRSHAPRFVTF